MPKGHHEIAASIIEKLFKQQGTIKGLIMNQSTVDKKLLYAIVCETLKYRIVLEEIIDRSGIGKTEKKLSKCLLLVLIYDQTYKQGVRTGPHKTTILKHKSRLNAELVKIKIKRKVKDNIDLIPEHIRNAIIIPRYVRINTLKTTVEAALVHYQTQGYKLQPYDEIMTLDVFPSKTMCRDKHLSELILLSPSADLHKDEYLLTGRVVLQDKASCFPAYILSPPNGAVVIDGCAAPGNKTSHLAARMGNSGTIYAFDMDRKRLDTLELLTGRAGCTNIKPVCGSFLEIDPREDKYAKVEYIMLDPSCSGSGIVGRMDHLTQDMVAEQEGEALVETPQDRVKSLSEFQKQVLLHAFTFPKVKRVVYSTCSKHKEENEEVVKHVLEANKNFRLVKDVFPEWTRRGEPIIKGAQHLIRTLPVEDKTIGFFVALFERFDNPWSKE